MVLIIIGVVIIFIAPFAAKRFQEIYGNRGGGNRGGDNSGGDDQRRDDDRRDGPYWGDR